MDVTIIREIVNNGKFLAQCLKTYDTDVIPIKDAWIEDPTWKEPVRVYDVTLNFHSNFYSALAVSHKIEDTKLLPDLITMYESHGWTVLKR